MNLTLFFRLILISIFQKSENQYNNYYYFYCPSVYAKDGFHVSLQIHSGNYCSSNNGYRKLGHTMEEVEFGFTSIHEPLMDEFAESNGNTTDTVGKIPISVLEQVFEKHGGIDWEKTISIEQFENFVKH